ncbi:MAG TPA: oligoendopeptidase F [Symbiobacteriaceae bacterium]|jgi:oligoendopeptidase F
MTARLTRAQVPEPETWNLDDLFPSHEVWEAGLNASLAAIPAVTQYKGRLGAGAGVLLACLEASEALQKQVIRVGTYASLRNSEDGTNTVNQGLAARTAAMHAKLGAALSFIRSEILALPDGTIDRYLAAEPGLKDFRLYLEELLEIKPHMLQPETEAVLAALGEVTNAPHMIYNRAKSSDMAFESVVDSEGQEHANSFAVYEGGLESAPDITLRRNAFSAFTQGLKRYQNTFAATFATEVTKNVVLARLRKYESATHMLLQPQQVTLEAYNNLLDVIQTELAPVMRRYARLSKQVQGLDQMRYCDIDAPLDPGFSPSVSYDEVRQIIIDGLSVLGPEYMEAIHTAFRDRWIDRSDNVGKSTGAFCSSPYGVHPFILITLTGSMREATVLAHELGHAGHFALAQRYQRVINTRPSMFFIEAPSTTNELLVGNHILAQSTDNRMRRWVLMQFLGTYYHNFVRHLLEGELQRRIYGLAEAGRPITASTLCETKGDILEQFWGGEVVVDDGARLTWMRQPHYYMGLYPYTYSAGLTLGTAVSQAIRTEGQPAVDRWLKTLKAGGTLKPLELAKLAGVDMSGKAAIQKAVAYVGSLVDELEKSF